MGNIVAATVTIRGTRPFWQHSFGPDVLSLDKKERTGVAGNDPEEWRRSCSVTPDGQLFFDGSYIFGCLRNAAVYTKSGRSNLQSNVIATLQVTTDKVLLDRYLPGYPNGEACDVQSIPEPSRIDTEPVYLDVRGVVNPSTKGRNVRYRLAVSPGWMATFGILWDKTIVSRSQMEAILIDAGRLVGIGSGRRIGMGRFEVVNMVIDELAP